MSYKYKAKNGLDFFVPGYGRSTNGIIELENSIESPALELVAEPEQVVASQVAAPNAVIGVAPQATAPTQQVEVVTPVQAVAPPQPEQTQINPQELN